MCCHFLFIFFNDTATTEIYTLSLHDALPISSSTSRCCSGPPAAPRGTRWRWTTPCARCSPTCAPWSCRPRSSRRRRTGRARSEEHTSELQSRQYLVCRLLLEKKKKTILSLVT